MKAVLNKIEFLQDTESKILVVFFLMKATKIMTKIIHENNPMIMIYLGKANFYSDKYHPVYHYTNSET